MSVVLMIASGVPIGFMLGGAFVHWLHRTAWAEGYRAGQEDAELGIDIHQPAG